MSIFYFVPRHKLGEQIARDFNKMLPGLTAAVYRGLERPDPQQPGKAMCHDLELSKACIKAGLSLGTVCEVCVEENKCGYRKQRNIKSDFWVLPNNFLFMQKPEWLPESICNVIDEGFIQKGLRGFDKNHPIRLTVSTFNEQPPPFPENQRKNDTSDRADLAAYRAKMEEALTTDEGFLTRQALEQAGLTAEDCVHAKKIEWRYKRDIKFQGPFSRSAVLAVLSKASTFNPRVPLVWGVAAELLEGKFDVTPCIKVRRDVEVGKGEGTTDYLQLFYRQDIAAAYANKPTLILDGAGQIELIRPYFPDVENVANVQAEIPHRHIRQITDRTCAKSMFVYPPNPTTASNNVKRLHHIQEVAAAKYRGKGKAGIDVLSVYQKDVEEALKAFRKIPGVTMAHHNDIAGSNEWEDVAYLDVNGRTLPPPAVYEHMAAVLTGKPVSTISRAGNNWHRFPVPIHKRNGSVEYVLSPRHPDPIVEALRWDGCEGQLLQIEARGRAVNRGPANQIDVEIRTNVPLPLPIDETTTWHQVQPSPVDLMVARGIVGLGWPTVAAVLPDMFKNAKAAKDWFIRNPDERERLKSIEKGENPYLYMQIGKFTLFTKPCHIRYKTPGNRRSRTAIIDIEVHPDPDAILSQLYGHPVEVLALEIIGPPEPDTRISPADFGLVASPRVEIVPPSGTFSITNGPTISTSEAYGTGYVTTSDGRVGPVGGPLRQVHRPPEPEPLISLHDARKPLGIGRVKFGQITKQYRHLSGDEKEKAIIGAMIKAAGPEKAKAFVDSLTAI